MPFKWDLSSCAQPSHFSLLLWHGPGRESLGLGPVFSLLSPKAAATEAPIWGQVEGKLRRQPPAQQGNGTWALICVASCLASENTATFWTCFSRLLRKHRMSKAYQYICTFSTWAPERLWARRGGRRVWGVFPAWEVSIRPNKVTLTPHLSLSFVPDNSCITAN